MEDDLKNSTEDDLNHTYDTLVHIHMIELYTYATIVQFDTICCHLNPFGLQNLVRFYFMFRSITLCGKACSGLFDLISYTQNFL